MRHITASGVLVIVTVAAGVALATAAAGTGHGTPRGTVVPVTAGK